MKWIDRPQYLERLLGLQNTPDIKIITGIRRCGKSCLLRAFRQQIQRQDPAANILSIDFTDLDWEELKDYRVLHRYRATPPRLRRVCGQAVPKRNRLCRTAG